MKAHVGSLQNTYLRTLAKSNVNYVKIICYFYEPREASKLITCTYLNVEIVLSKRTISEIKAHVRLLPNNNLSILAKSNVNYVKTNLLLL